MFRALLLLLAVVIAVLAFLFERPLLYVGAIVPLIGVFGLLMRRLWDASLGSSGTEKEPPSGFPSRDESLENFGIMDVRPHQNEDAQSERSQNGDVEREEAPEEGSTDRGTRPGDSPLTNDSPSPKEEAHSPSSNRKPGEASESVSFDATEQSEDAKVLRPLLESLRTALDAQTVCLLVQEEVLLSYHIRALASAHSAVKRTGTFDTQVPLLTASMSRQSVGVQTLAGAELSIEDLGYYVDPPDVDHIAVAPLSRPDDPASSFLLVDASVGVDLGSSRARGLMKHFAETASLLLDEVEGAGAQESVEERLEARSDGHTSPSAQPKEPESVGEGPERPRPRRDIIAEEMNAAEGASNELALVLVHLNRAESISRRGAEAVASAEKMLRARLEERSRDHRVERFGELTYGIFFRGEVEGVEAWAADLQERMAQESGALEGGVSVGVAVRGDRHDGPEALRRDATEALWEAYETGTCTIVT